MSIEVPFIILIISVPLYFLTRWMFKKWNIGSEKNRKYIAIIPSILISPIIYVGIIVIWIFSISYYPTKPFDKTEWKDNVEERYKMSSDIIESEMLIGLTKEEVIEILGDEYYSYNDNLIHYGLGFVPGLLNIDPDALDIYFENGKVVRVDQHET